MHRADERAGATADHAKTDARLTRLFCRCFNCHWFLQI